MKKLLMILFLSLAFASSGFCAAYTTARGTLMDWTLLNDTGTAVSYLETDPLVTDTWMGTRLFIDVAHIDADTGSADTIVIIWAKSGATDEYWHKVQELSISTGTAANIGDIDASSASGQTKVFLTATTNFEKTGLVYFLHDVGDITASAVVVVGDGKTGAGNYTSCVDNLVNTYATDDYAYDIVDQWAPRLGPGYTYRVTFHNTDTAANYAVRVLHAEEKTIE